MAVFGIVDFLMAVLFFVLIYYWRLNRHTPMPFWPLLGMLPSLLFNLSNLHDYITSLLKQQKGTFMFQGPCLTNMYILFTCDAMNVQHITSTKFHSYGKGDRFREIFAGLGEGIFRSESQTWKYNRTLLHSIFKQPSFQLFTHKTLQNKVESSLLAFLDHASNQGVQVDLQDVFQRLTFDNICSTVLGFDPSCLSTELPQVACEKAFNEGEHALFYRHVLPNCMWKLMQWLQIGPEKKLREGQRIIDEMLYREIASNRKKQGESKSNNLLNAVIHEVGEEKIDGKFLRDTSLNLLAAGRDTISAGLTWFFWLVATHPSVEAKILEEIKQNLPSKGGNWKDISEEGLNKLIYLQAAISEALRLYPPVAFEHKCALKSDMLPSGHRVDSNIMIVYSLYSMGRMEEIWGHDCLQFRPERWISNKGGIVHVPSYKFIAFNAGPRSCLGKDMSLTQMKMIAVAILWNYCIHVVEGHPISPCLSVILHMKHGLKVMLTKRSI